MNNKTILFTLIIALFQGMQLSAQNIWTQKASFGGGTTSEARGFSIGSKGYVCGATAAIWEFDPASNVWTQMATFPGNPRNSSAAFSIGNKGYMGTGGGLNDFWEYDQATNFWTQKTNFGGSGREGAVGIEISGKGYIGTGGNYLNDWWEYDPSNDTWTQKANLAGPGRYHAGAFSVLGKGYVCTGFNGSFFNDLMEYNPVSNSWVTKSSLPGSTRDRPVGFAIGNKGYIGTGWTGSIALNDFYEYDPTSDTWLVMPAYGGIPTYNSTGFSILNKGYIGMGTGSGSAFWEFGSTCSAQISSTTTTCYGSCDGSATISIPDSNAIVSIIWSTTPVQSSLTATGLCAISYSATITDTAGCTSITQITIPQPPQINGTFTAVEPTCFGSLNGSLCISASNGNSPYTYIWNNGTTGNCINSAAAGNYTATVTGADGCTAAISAVLNQPLSINTNINHLDASCVTCNDGNAAISVTGGVSPFTYLWSNGSTDSYLPYLLPGEYICCVTDANGCSVCDTVNIGFLTAVTNHVQQEFSIFPNPFQNEIIVQAVSNFDANSIIEFYDFQGRKMEVLSTFLSDKIIIHTTDIPKGLYSLRIFRGFSQSIFKIIKM